MIRRYKVGEHINTEAPVLDLKVENDINSYFTFLDNGITFSLDKNDVIYGLGEQVRGLNKRGWIYNSLCSDETDHYEDRHSLYGAHNFILVHGKNDYGIFIDTPSKVIFDIGYTHYDKVKITILDSGFDVYLITNNTLNDIVKEFRTLIGKSYKAPLFSFGYQQSRWSYMNEEEVLEVIDKHHNNDLPLECLYLDIDYMTDYKDFTINTERFPDIKLLNDKLKARNTHLIPIIDAGVKNEKDYFLYEEGIKNNYFTKDKDGNNFNAAVWPGLVHFPDFLRSDVREWFGSKYKILTDLGFDGFWNDMNEPAMFYTPERLLEVINNISKYKNMTIDDMNLEVSGVVKGGASSLQNNIDDYAKMYHLIDDKLISHKELHNIYGYNMTKSAYLGLDKVLNTRSLLFSRASYIGAHRYGGIWTGDNKSIWSHIELLMHQLPNLNMCGFIYTGSDTGGFGSDATMDLVLRWLELSMFTPLMRNHACSGTRRQEVYNFSNLDDFRNILKLRYSFVPYLYSEYLKAVENDEMMFKPLSFVYDDPRCLEIEDQLLVGDSIMICPMYKQNQTHRYVYLPEDMRMLRFRTLDDYDTEVLVKGHHYISCKLNEVVIFIRPNKIFVTTNYKPSIEELEMTNLIAFSYIKDEISSYDYYLDDGISKENNTKVYSVSITPTEILSDIVKENR